MKEKVLLDTDIGNDIDDTVCLAYLLCQEKCDLLGITTVSGEPIIRAQLTSALLKSVKRDNIPIYPGAENPILIPQKQVTAHQKRFLPGCDYDTDFPEGKAIDFMRQTIRENPGEVTLLAIGPMTNIAHLFLIDPEIPILLKQLVLMCGVFKYSYLGSPCLTEWNSRCDPHASAIVYKAPVKNIISVGLDVTQHVTLSKEDIIESFDNDILKTVYAFSGIEDGSRQQIVFHDPLAAAMIFEKDICKFERGNVEVLYDYEKVEGLTRFTQDESGKNEIAVEVDRERYFKHYFDIVKGIK